MTLTKNAAALRKAIGQRLTCDRHWIDQSAARQAAVRELVDIGLVRLHAIGLDWLVLEPAPGSLGRP